MKERFLGFVDLRVKPFWMRPLFFWIATLLQLTWPYCWLFRAKTGEIHYTVKKKIYKTATVPNGEGPVDAAIADQVIVSTTEKKTLSALNLLSAVCATNPAIMPNPEVSWPSHPSYSTRVEFTAASSMFCGTDVAAPMSGVTNSVSHTAPCSSLPSRYSTGPTCLTHHAGPRARLSAAIIRSSCSLSPLGPLTSFSNLWSWDSACVKDTGHCPTQLSQVSLHPLVEKRSGGSSFPFIEERGRRNFENALAITGRVHFQGNHHVTKSVLLHNAQVTSSSLAFTTWFKQCFRTFWENFPLQFYSKISTRKIGWYSEGNTIPASVQDASAVYNLYPWYYCTRTSCYQLKITRTMHVYFWP